MVSNKILIYGSKGFLATSFKSELVKRGIKYIAASRENVNMNDIDSVSNFISNNDFESVFFSVGPAPCKSQKMYYENLHLLLNLLSVLNSINKKPKITYISSDAVYGSTNKNPRNELTDTHPDTLHGQMHLIREEILKASDFPFLILRCSGIFGKGDRHNSYGPNRFYSSLRLGQDIVLFGKGDDVRDHIWIDDFGKISADLHSKVYGTLNLVSGNSRAFREIAELMLKHSKMDLNLIFQSNNSSPSFIYYDNSKLTSLLGYEISDSLERGIASYTWK